MRRLKAVLRVAAEQLMFGTDTLLGLCAYMALTIAFGIEPNILHLLLALFFAYLPDGDMIPYLLLRKPLKLTGHWVIGHHPLIVIPLATIATYVLASWLGGPLVFLATLAAVCVTQHFLHDTMRPQGFPWLSPFGGPRLTLSGFSPRIVSEDAYAAYDATRENDHQREITEEIAARADRISNGRLIAWGLILIVIPFWWNAWPR